MAQIGELKLCQHEILPLQFPQPPRDLFLLLFVEKVKPARGIAILFFDSAAHREFQLRNQRERERGHGYFQKITPRHDAGNRHAADDQSIRLLMNGMDEMGKMIIFRNEN